MPKRKASSDLALTTDRPLSPISLRNKNPETNIDTGTILVGLVEMHQWMRKSGTIVNHFKSLLLVTNNLSSWRSYSFVKRSQFAASFAHNLPVADGDFINSSTHFCPRRFESVKSEKMANNVDDNQVLLKPQRSTQFQLPI